MFLFLSKLLPLFLYPLGFASLMLLIALFTFWKRPRIAGIAIFIALLALLLPGNSWVANGWVRSLESQYLPTAIPTADAVVVLGGAVKPQIAPRPWIDVAEAGDRPLYGAQLYLQGKAPLIILSGGRIEWQGGGAPSESADMAKLVEALGVPANVILQDPTSLNTRENAVNVKKIMQDRGIQKILLVTSAIHMPRSMAIFKKLGVEAIAAPTDFLVSNQELEEPQGTTQAIILNLFPDSGNLEKFTRALKEYVGLIVYGLRGWA
ncbi:MAG: YdcF family protein [Timaviella obliquedivisa GSE-PSE-MK23-08B]|jgi:uncharacterized SAM-binding protein YcdF (DUF218 family)|nr:YdcF family protein [Timaviella obliquedivisa GSE-PSE-MK23-08B]